MVRKKASLIMVDLFIAYLQKRAGNPLTRIIIFGLIGFLVCSVVFPLLTLIHFPINDDTAIFILAGVLGLIYGIHFYVFKDLPKRSSIDGEDDAETLDD